MPKNLSKIKGLKGALLRHETRETTQRQKDQKAAATLERAKLKKALMHGGNKSAPKRGLNPFDKDQKLLLVGEGDFSFAASIVKENFVDGLIATCYDSESEVLRKYPLAKQNIEYLEKIDVQVLYEIDAKQLVRTLKLKKKPLEIDTIMFNFPHKGKGIKDMDRNIVEHQKLLLAFFQQCQELFKFGKVEGKVIVTLFEGEPYRSWTIKSLAKGQGLRLERSGLFQWLMFPDYQHMRTNSTRDTTKPALEREARLYIFKETE